MRKISLLLLGLLFSSVQSYKVSYRSLGQIKVPQPAFVKVGRFSGQEDFLMISQFEVTGAGKVSVIPNIQSKVNSRDFANIKHVELSNAFTWPNKIEEVPPEVFGQGVNAIAVPDGFLVPFHSNGNVFIVTTDPADVSKQTGVHQLTAKKSGFFYHMGRWVDLNGDGRLDYLTARSNAKAGAGELLWLEHPEGGLQQVPWQEHVITKGPDVMFDLIDHPAHPDSHLIFASEFFNKQLSLYEIDKQTGALKNQRTIDSSIDQAYSVKYVDIDGDGEKELLVNNHESDNKKAALFLYYVPQDDLFEGQFVKHVIASGFKNAFSLTGMNMCPGFPYQVYPDSNKRSGMSHILIAGDGDHSAHLLRPTGDPEDMFERELIKDFQGTVGAITTSDVNQNGWIEFYVANYDKNYVEVFEFFDADAKTFEEENSRDESTQTDDEDYFVDWSEEGGFLTE